MSPTMSLKHKHNPEGSQQHPFKEERWVAVMRPLRWVLLPGAVAKMRIDVDKASVQLVEEQLWNADKDSQWFGIVPQLPSLPSSSTESPSTPLWGCLCRVVRIEKTSTSTTSTTSTSTASTNTPEGDEVRFRLVVEGVMRMEVLAWTQESPYAMAKVRVYPPDPSLGGDARDPSDTAELRGLAQQWMHGARLPSPTYTSLAQHMLTLSTGKLTDLLGNLVPLTPEQKYQLLATLDAKERAQSIAKMLAAIILKQQRQPITSGSSDNASAEVSELQELRQRLDKAQLPAHVAHVVDREWKRLLKIPAMQAEHTVLRSYLEWVADLPWINQAAKNDTTSSAASKLDLAAARNQLDSDHFGLDKVKLRILQYLAVQKLHPHSKAPILCLVGPPGVGKTSLGKSIAQALGRKFHRIALGGARDVADIKGHRRTYIGSMPGLILQGMKAAGVPNPVFLLDEVDKLGRDPLRGDPTSALLEVLDPEQNHSFQDLYLNLPYNLSRVTFIATANTLDTIPAPLLDRMEVLRLAGYTHEEKMHIAKRYLLPKQLAACGLEGGKHLSMDDATILHLISAYTREPGVRSLERQLASLCRAIAFQVVSLPDGTKWKPQPLTQETLVQILGPPMYEDEIGERLSIPGVATGLAWTSSGSGGLLFIECSYYPGKGNLVLTGRLGEVIRESAQTALSWVRSHLHELHFPSQEQQPERQEQLVPVIPDWSAIDVHIHFPAGAVPKDGPSAGVTLLLALVSLFTNRVCRSDTAMTGEITLRGLVLPVGGIKEKVLAAHRAGLKRVLLPERNRRDVLADVPRSVQQEMEFLHVRNVEEAVRQVLGDFHQHLVHYTSRL